MAATLLMALSGTFQPINAQIYEWLDQAGDRGVVVHQQNAKPRAVGGFTLRPGHTGWSSRKTSTALRSTTSDSAW